MKSLEVGVRPTLVKMHSESFGVVVFEGHPIERAYAVQVMTNRQDWHVVGFDAPKSMFSALGGSLTDLKYLLLDLQMSEMDGFQVIRHLAEDGHTVQLSVVSSHESWILNAAAQMARSLGLVNNPSLHKPYVPKQLLALLAGSEAVHVDAVERRASDLSWDVMRGIGEGQCCVHDQPKVSCHTGSCVGFEILSRWYYSEFGFVQPSDCIAEAQAQAQARGQLDRLARHVLTVALSQAKRWLLQGDLLSLPLDADGVDDCLPHWVGLPSRQADQAAIMPFVNATHQTTGTAC